MSVLSWCYYLLGVSLLVGLGSVALESVLRAAGRSGRWAWVMAFALLALLPLVAWLFPALPSPPMAMEVLALPSVLLAPMTAGSPPVSSSPFPWALFLGCVWIAASFLVVLALVLSYVSLRRAARVWRNLELDDLPLLVSAHTGPAVVGLRRPRIVVPEWVLELSASDRRLLLLHEQEHLRAGDARLLALALGVCALVPWNPVVWWALHRLRAAVELDCDTRVLGRSGDPAGYGRLLLEVGRRRSERHLLAAAFAEPRVLLERRVRALVQWPHGRRPLTALAAGAAALLCFGFAYATPRPLARGQQPAAPAKNDAAGVQLPVAQGTPPPSGQPAFTPSMVPPELSSQGDPSMFIKLTVPSDTPPPALRERPTFAPMTVRPELSNPQEVQKALLAEYPPLLRTAGIGGTVSVWVLLDEAGGVFKTQLGNTSGYEALDSAGLRVARHMQFTPAENRGVKVAVWVEIPIVFNTGTRRPVERTDSVSNANRRVVREVRGNDTVSDANRRAVREVRGAGTVADANRRVVREVRGADTVDAAAPDPSGMPAKSETEARVEVRGIVNQAEVTQALLRGYPPLLRDAGIGGTVTMWLYVEPDGSVSKAQVAKSSGHQALDEAALKLASIIRFSKAPAAGWVQVPFAYALR